MIFLHGFVHFETRNIYFINKVWFSNIIKVTEVEYKWILFNITAADATPFVVKVPPTHKSSM